MQFVFVLLPFYNVQKQLQEAAANPFRNTVVKDVGEAVSDNFDFDDMEEIPDKEDHDITKEYAIVEIIGLDNETVAKLANRKLGKYNEFIVHKGTVMQDGSVVTSITDKYVSFENPDGERSYLYPGGMVMDYEPENPTLKDSSETSTDGSTDVAPVPAVVNDNSTVEQEKLSKSPKRSSAVNNRVKAPKNTSSSKSTKKKSSKRQRRSLPSFGSGMFAD